MALSERLRRVRRRRVRSLDAIVERFRALPVLDERSAAEILGYDDHGIAR